MLLSWAFDLGAMLLQKSVVRAHDLYVAGHNHLKLLRNAADRETPYAWYEAALKYPLVLFTVTSS